MRTVHHWVLHQIVKRVVVGAALEQILAVYCDYLPVIPRVRPDSVRANVYRHAVTTGWHITSERFQDVPRVLVAEGDAAKQQLYGDTPASIGEEREGVTKRSGELVAVTKLRPPPCQPAVVNIVPPNGIRRVERCNIHERMRPRDHVVHFLVQMARVPGAEHLGRA